MALLILKYFLWQVALLLLKFSLADGTATIKNFILADGTAIEIFPLAQLLLKS